MMNNDIFVAMVNEAIKGLIADYEKECESISIDCEAEGWPPYGSNYDLRCTALWEDYYRPQLEYWEGLLED